METALVLVHKRRVVAEIRSALGFAWFGNSRDGPGGTNPLASAPRDSANGQFVQGRGCVAERRHQSWVSGWALLDQQHQAEAIV